MTNYKTLLKCLVKEHKARIKSNRLTRKAILRSVIKALKYCLSKKTYEEGMCGVPGFHSSKRDPFYNCCCVHDAMYEIVKPGMSTKKIDMDLYDCCIDVAFRYPSIYELGNTVEDMDSAVPALSKYQFDVVEDLEDGGIMKLWLTREVLVIRAKLYYRACRKYGTVREWLGKLGLWKLGKKVGSVI